MKVLKLAFALFAIAVVALVPVALFAAQEVATPIAPPNAVAQLALAITALAPIVLPFVVYGVRLVLPKIPRVALPVVAMALGFGVNLLASYIAGHEFSPLIGAALGAASVWVREIANTVSEHGLSA